MIFRSTAILLLPILLGSNLASAAREQKYQQAHQLTPDQAALVQKAIAR